MSAPLKSFKLDQINADGAIVRRDPFPFIVAKGVVAESERKALASDFTHFSEAGYFPFDDDTGPAVKQLVEEVTSKEVANALGDKLGIDNLSQYPTMTTIMRQQSRRHGTIHTDSRSKVATALIYLNETWNGTSDGCLRLLNSATDIDDVVVPEVIPLYGGFVMFKRADNSYHGHLPFEGERHVVQIAWVTSQEEIDRKKKRGKFSSMIKGLLGGLDKHLGAGRGRSAAHLK